MRGASSREFFALLGMALAISVIIALIIVAFAGSGGLPPGGDDGGPTATPTGTPEEPPGEPTGTRMPPTAAPTDEVVLRLSDLGTDYNFTGESVSTAEDVSGEQARLFEERGIVKTHARTFRLSTETVDRPDIVISSATAYRSPEAAAAGLDRQVSSLEGSGATLTRVNVAVGVNATGATFENERGLRTAAIYGRTGSLVYSVTASSPDDYPRSAAADLFLKMHVDATP